MPPLCVIYVSRICVNLQYPCMFPDDLAGKYKEVVPTEMAENLWRKNHVYRGGFEADCPID